ncbi:MAG: hypothetical protein MMC33_003335 [Icmadophila ericetorum]|nr:hypothetical protein [Icmadophila ericetorum]
MDGPWDSVDLKPTVKRVDVWEISGKPKGQRLHELEDDIKLATRQIYKCCHHPVAWYNRAIYLEELGYSDLAAGDFYKAILLCNAALDNVEETRAMGDYVRLILGMGLWMFQPELWNQVTAEDFRAAIEDTLSQTRIRSYDQLTRCMNDMQAFWDLYHLGEETVTKLFEKIPSDLDKDTAESLLARPLQAVDALRASYRLWQKHSGITDDLQLIETMRTGNSYSRQWPWLRKSRLRRSKKLLADINREMEKASDGKLVVRNSAIRDGLGGDSKESPDVLGVFAAKDIAAGDLALLDSTMLSALDYPDTNSCSHCQRIFSWPPTHCSNLNCSTRFCTDLCLEMASECYHKPLCGKDFSWMYTEGEPRENQHAAIMLRIIAASVQRGCHPLEHTLIARLTATYAGDKLEGYSFKGQITTPHRILEQLTIDPFSTPHFDTWVLRTIRSRLMTNMLKDHSRSRDMVAVMPLYSLFNHSCSAPLSYRRIEHHEGTSDLALCADVGIRRGDEVFVKYVACEDGSEVRERRERLWCWFGGGCACERCAREAGDAGEEGEEMEVGEGKGRS